jgi:hypothetical protein
MGPMYPQTGLAVGLCSGYTCPCPNEPTRAASLTQMAPGEWVSFPTQQVVSSPPTWTCEGEHAKTERGEKGASPSARQHRPGSAVMHRGAVVLCCLLQQVDRIELLS